MNPVRVRNVVIGEGMPKICVPVMGAAREEIIKEAGMVSKLSADMAEWRADWYEDAYNIRRVKETAEELRETLADMPLLFTFRTAKEGGEKEIDAADYCALNKEIIASGYVDLIDVEAFTGDIFVEDIIREAHKYHVKVVASNHDFLKTPEKNEIVSRLRRMQEMGADISKIAVMPQSERDVLTLLAATEEMTRKYADRPLITMSMSGSGVISRLCGEVFGSAVTFGAAERASAPGQMKVEDLRTVLSLLHRSMQQ